MEYTDPTTIEYDFVVMVDGHYIASYTRNVKLTGTFVPIKYANAWEDGTHVTMSKYGTANVNGYLDNTMMFGNGNGAQVRSDYKMLPGSWLEMAHPTPSEIVGPLSIGAYGCQWVLTNDDRSEEANVTASDGLQIHYQSSTSHNQYLHGVNFSRNTYAAFYEDPAL